MPHLVNHRITSRRQDKAQAKCLPVRTTSYEHHIMRWTLIASLAVTRQSTTATSNKISTLFIARARPDEGTEMLNGSLDYTERRVGSAYRDYDRSCSGRVIAPALPPRRPLPVHGDASIAIRRSLDNARTAQAAVRVVLDG